MEISDKDFKDKFKKWTICKKAQEMSIVEVSPSPSSRMPEVCNATFSHDSKNKVKCRYQKDIV